jgi:hypothetical protein
MTKVKSNPSRVNPKTPTKANVSFTIEDLKDIGDASSLIQAVHQAIREYEVNYTREHQDANPYLKKLKCLRDKIIQTQYDQNTYNLIELILSEETPTCIKPEGEFNEQNWEKFNDRCKEARNENIAAAKKLKPKKIDLNRDYFAHMGGVALVIKALTNSIPVLKHQSGNPYDPDINILQDLRDILVQEHYGWEAFGLFESITE